MMTITEFIQSLFDRGKSGKILLCVGTVDDGLFIPLTGKRWVETLTYQNGWCGLKNPEETFLVYKAGTVTNIAVNLLETWLVVKEWEVPPTNVTPGELVYITPTDSRKFLRLD